MSHIHTPPPPWARPFLIKLRISAEFKEIEKVTPITPEVTSFEQNLSELYANIETPTWELSEDALLDRITGIDKFVADIEVATKGIKAKFKGEWKHWYAADVVGKLSDIEYRVVSLIEKIRRETNPSKKTILFSNLKQTLHSAVANYPGINEYYSNKLGVDISCIFEAVSRGNLRSNGILQKQPPKPPQVCQRQGFSLLC